MSELLRAALQRQWLAYKARNYEDFQVCVNLAYAVAMAEGWPLGRLYSLTGEAYPSSPSN